MESYKEKRLREDLQALKKELDSPIKRTASELLQYCSNVAVSSDAYLAEQTNQESIL